MYKFTCTKCNEKIQATDDLESFFKTRTNNQCLQCYSPIFNKEYPTGNDLRTVFTSVANFGDRIWLDFIIRQYVNANPTEKIRIQYPEGHCDYCQTAIHYYDKMFISNCSQLNKQVQILSPKEYIFNLSVEVQNYVKSGVRLDTNIEPKKPECLTFVCDNKTVIFHVRDLDKQPEKNVPEHEFLQIIDLFENYNWKVVLIGTGDYKDLCHYWPYDFRDKLTDNEILWLIDSAGLYIGKDSGQAHFASTTNTKMICWGYQEKMWFPKVYHSWQGDFFLKSENFSIVLDKIKDYIISRG